MDAAADLARFHDCVFPPPSWGNFLGRLKPAVPGQGGRLLASLGEFPAAPPISWYPAGGCDLMPLALDVPNNPARRRLHRLNPDSAWPVSLFWMTDFRGYENYFGENYYPGHLAEFCEHYQAAVTIGPEAERYRYSPGPEEMEEVFASGRLPDFRFYDEIDITLFTVRVENAGQGNHTRQAGGDEYLVVYSSCEAGLCLENLLARYRITVSSVTLIQSPGELYTELAERIVELEPRIGPVDFWCMDRVGQDENGRPRCRSLKHYEYVGGPLNWGRSPARLYARPGLPYYREDRPERIGTSWCFR